MYCAGQEKLGITSGHRENGNIFEPKRKDNNKYEGETFRRGYTKATRQA